MIIPIYYGKIKNVPNHQPVIGVINWLLTWGSSFFSRHDEPGVQHMFLTFFIKWYMSDYEYM
jgi:hypothetical protein